MRNVSQECDRAVLCVGLLDLLLRPLAKEAPLGRLRSSNANIVIDLGAVLRTQTAYFFAALRICASESTVSVGFDMLQAVKAMPMRGIMALFTAAVLSMLEFMSHQRHYRPGQRRWLRSVR